MNGRALVAVGAVAIVLGCSPPPQTTEPTSSSAIVSATSPTASGTSTPGLPKPVFENPGGMWLPEQLAMQAETFKKVGFSLDASVLTKPTEFPLGAVVSLGGCSASFVSPDGLIITNHHCVIGTLQINEKKTGKPLIKDGYLAKTRADELSAGPAGKVLVTQSIKDVTAVVRADLATMKDDMARYQAVDDRQKKLVAECEKGREKTIRCSVVSVFGGAEFRLIEQMELRDLRLVYAPPTSVGAYGGETDNWRWPRHCGDFAFYRAYTAPDGKPADPNDLNVPYRPQHVIKLAKEGLAPGDAVLVAGYPARTNRLTTATETNDALKSDMPYDVEFFQAYLAEIDALKKANADVANPAETYVRGFSNILTKTQGEIEGLEKGGLADKKAKEEAELEKWIDADPARKTTFGGAVGEVSKQVRESRKTLEADRVLRELTRVNRLFVAAYRIVRNAEERPKEDAARDAEYQTRNQSKLEAIFKQMTASFNATLDGALLRVAAERELKHPEGKRAGLADAILGKKKPGGDPKADLAKAIQEMYASTKIGNQEERLKLLKSATLADLQKSKDPFIKLALALRPKLKELEDRDKQLQGAMLLTRPKFVTAMKEKAGGLLAPDANGTLRITYGTVRGYSPKPNAPVYMPFTLLDEIVKKHTGVDPFDAPKPLLDAIAAKKFGAYVDPKLGQVPVNYLSDLDITNGNSGSSTLNARGELVGLAFDGNYESMASNWIFIPEITRTIHVDLRYILWVLDAVAGADELLQELGVVASVQ